MKNPIIFINNKKTIKLGLGPDCTCETRLECSIPTTENINYEQLQKQDFYCIEIGDDKFIIWNENSRGITVVNRDGLEFIQNIDINATDKQTLDLLIERGILGYRQNE